MLRHVRDAVLNRYLNLRAVIDQKNLEQNFTNTDSKELVQQAVACYYSDHRRNNHARNVALLSTPESWTDLQVEIGAYARDLLETPSVKAAMSSHAKVLFAKENKTISRAKFDFVLINSGSATDTYRMTMSIYA